MLLGKHLPSWINAVDKEKREEVIKSISVNDVFRSQFRSEEDAPKSSIEILNWGLNHIDRLRQGRIDRKERNIKIILPVASLIIAGLSILMTYYTVRSNNETQEQLKKYEVTFKIKQENYSRFMQGLYDTFESTRRNYPISSDDLFRNINQLEVTYFNIEPFLNDNQRAKLWSEYLDFTSMCISFDKYNHNTTLNPKQYNDIETKYLDSLLIYKDNFHRELYPILFKNQ